MQDPEGSALDEKPGEREVGDRVDCGLVVDHEHGPGDRLGAWLQVGCRGRRLGVVVRQVDEVAVIRQVDEVAVVRQVDEVVVRGETGGHQASSIRAAVPIGRRRV